MDVTLGQYRVTGTVGLGGMGIVYAAEHSLLGRPAAIKVLRAELSQKQDAVTRFFNEARAATAIRHPGIIDIYDFGWTDTGAAYLVMEYLEGDTLGRRCARTRLSWQTALTIARQIAGALGAAHAKGIVHRDLKPDNVFLVPDPEVPGGERIKLLDFGVAKLTVDSSSTLTVTQTGAVIGTPTYMAPEQCRGVGVDHRADLYALGCVMYELCCGRPPFRGEATGDLIAAHIYMPVPPMASANVEVPAAVEALVRRLLAKAPGDRLQTAEEVIFAIDAVNGERTLSMDPPAKAAPLIHAPARVMTTLSGSAVMTAPPRTRLRWSVAAVSAAMVAVAAAVAMLAMLRGEEAVPVVPAAAAAPLPIASEPVRIELVRSAAVAALGREPESPTPSPSPSAPLAVDAVIDSAPAGAEVVLGGEVLGTTPFRGQLPRSDRDVTLVIRRAGYVDRAIAVHATEPIHERVTLARRPPPAPAPAPVPAKRAANDRDRSVNPFD